MLSNETDVPITVLYIYQAISFGLLGRGGSRGSSTRGTRGRGRGHRGGGLGRGGGGHSVDRRPKCLQITGHQHEETDAVVAHFSVSIRGCKAQPYQ